jgi:RimJ/RimL family protein N-acetyltransferase
MDVIETPRLRLRPHRPEDSAALMAGLNDFEVARYLTVVPYPYQAADAEEWLAIQTPPRAGKAVFAIERPGIGMVGAISIENELGFWLARPHWGQGLMSEAARALLDWQFAALPDDLVRSGAHLGNEASLGVQRKLGFVDAGTRSLRFVRSLGREVEHVETTLTRQQFRATSPAGAR